MAGVPGTQSRITLSFHNPGGAKTGKTLPTGNPVNTLHLQDGTTIEASLVDVSNPGVFIRAQDILPDFGKAGVEVSQALRLAVEGNTALKARLEMIRRAGTEKMGLDPSVPSVPKIVMVFPPGGAKGDLNLRCLAMSMGQAHQAVPLTLALCLGAAAYIPGTIPANLVRWATSGAGKSIVIGHPTGEVEIGATLDSEGSVGSAELHRTARLLMRGTVFY